MEIQSVGVLLLKATALLATGLGAAAALRRAPAGTRHAVWLTTVAGVLALPLVASLPPIRLQVLPALSEAPRHGAPAAAPVAAVSTPVEAPLARRFAPGSPRENRAASAVAPGTWPRPTVVRIVAFAWAAIALALLGRLAVGLVAVRRIVRKARAAEGPTWQAVLADTADRLGLPELPALVMSDRVDMPFASGLWRGTIVLPASAEHWSDDRRRLVLFHELAHMKRRDLLGHLLGRLACAVYWFHPLVWTAARRLRAESEKACDDLVLSSGTRPSDYASHLLEILTSARRTGLLTTAVAMARKTEFEGRMLAILDPAAPRGVLGRFRAALLTTSLALVFLGLAALAPTQPTSAATVTARQVASAEQAAEVREQPPQPSQSSPANQAARNPHRNREARLEAQREREHEEREEKTDETEDDEPPMSAEQAAVLARVLRSDADANVRRSAAWALESAGHTAAAEALIAALKADADDGVREMATWALADVPGDSVSAALAAALQGDRNEDVRAVAAWALGQRERTNTAALEAAAADRAVRVRESAIWALGNQDLEKATAAMLASLRDTEAPVRRVAAWAVGQTGDPAAASALRTAFKDEKDDEVRKAVFHALMLVGERSPEVIVQVLESTDPELRAQAVQMMSRHRGPWPWPWPRPDPRPMP